MLRHLQLSYSGRTRNRYWVAGQVFFFESERISPTAAARISPTGAARISPTGAARIYPTGAEQLKPS